MTLFIAITGLFLLLEPEGSSHVEVLFLNSGGYSAEFEGENYVFSEHEMRVRIGALAGAHPTWIPGEPLEMGLLQVVSTPTEFVNVAGLLTGSEFLPGCQPTVRKGCSGPLALVSCRDGQRNLLSGRLTLTGGSLRPAEVTEFDVDTQWNSTLLPDCNSDGTFTSSRPADEELWELQPLDESAINSSPFVTKTFNGILYKIELDEESAQLALGKSILEVRAEKDPICGTLQPGLNECAYIRIDNSVEKASEITAGHEHVQAEETAAVDLHFMLNYEIVQSLQPLCTRYIPVWKLREQSKVTHCEPGGLGSRCVPACACTKSDRSRCNC